MHFVKHITKKWWFWLISIVLVSWGMWYAYSWYDSWKYNAPYRESYVRAVAQVAKMEAEQAALEARYAADFDGGATPQETWDLFVAALEAGNTDRAAKYFIVERQEEEKRAWAVAKDLGNIPIFLEDFKLIKGGTMYPDGDRFEFYTGSIDNGPGFVYMLVKNPITGVWKIEDL